MTDFRQIYYKPADRQLKSPVAKHLNKFCKPSVLTDEKKERMGYTHA